MTQVDDRFPLEDRVGCSEALLEELQVVTSFQSLREVLTWGLCRKPMGEFFDVVIQDEYTHDIIYKLDEGLFLVFDTT